MKNNDRINVHVGADLKEELDRRQAEDPDKPTMAIIVRRLLRKGIVMEQLQEEAKEGL